MKVLHSICQQIWKTQQWPQDWKRAVFIPIPKKGNAKECSNYRTIAVISHTSKVMLKILQARLQEYINRELPDVQAGFRKGRGTRDQIANIHWIMEKAREFQKNIYIHRVEFGEVSGHRVLIKRGPGNRGASQRGSTQEATSGMQPRDPCRPWRGTLASGHKPR